MLVPNLRNFREKIKSGCLQFWHKYHSREDQHISSDSARLFYDFTIPLYYVLIHNVSVIYHNFHYKRNCLHIYLQIMNLHNCFNWQSAVNACFSHYNWYQYKWYNGSDRNDKYLSNIVYAACCLYWGPGSSCESMSCWFCYEYNVVTHIT